MKRIGLQAGPLSQWLHAGLKRAGFEIVLLETRHVKAALSAMTVKTDARMRAGLLKGLDADQAGRQLLEGRRDVASIAGG